MNAKLDPTTQQLYTTTFYSPPIIDARSGIAPDADNNSATADPFYLVVQSTTQELGPIDPVTGTPLSTAVWGYAAPAQGIPTTYPGPTFLAKTGVPISVQFVNNLTGPHPLLSAADLTNHNAVGHGQLEGFASGLQLPIVSHLHGGHVAAENDGGPDYWYTQDNSMMMMGHDVPPQDDPSLQYYPNDQSAGNLWYHDHTLGLTRLNVYAGLAGVYLLKDDYELKQISEGTLPDPFLGYEQGLVVQDRMFTTDGQLYMPSAVGEFYGGPLVKDPAGTTVDSAGIPIDIPAELAENRQALMDFLGTTTLPGVPEPSVLPEFFGDSILVNGKLWPNLDVDRTKYRFHVLNGSDSRFYVFELRDTATETSAEGTSLPFLQIGRDASMLEQPVEKTQLLLAPGQRADIVIDFKALADLGLAHDDNGDGKLDLYWRNYGPDEPFGKFEDIGTFKTNELTSQIVQFSLNAANPDVPLFGVNTNTPIGPQISTRYNPGGDLSLDRNNDGNLNRDDLQNINIRRVGLFEAIDSRGRLMPILGEQTGENDQKITMDTFTWDDPTLALPELGKNEIWEVYNLSADSHPLHLHQVNFRVLERSFLNVDPTDPTGETYLGVTKNPKVQLTHDGLPGQGWNSTIDLGTAVGNWEGPRPDEARATMDTLIVQPGEVVRIMSHFDNPGEYVWHCHILSHEDHEMMRRLDVKPDGQDNAVSLMDDSAFMATTGKGSLFDAILHNGPMMPSMPDWLKLTSDY